MGIAEANMMSVAAGLQLGRLLLPVVSPYLQLKGHVNRLGIPYAIQG